MGRNKVLYDKQQIIDIAVMIVEEEGIEVLSARRIASELGVSSMTMYNYVSNIDEVKRELMIRGYNELFHNIIQKLALKEKRTEAVWPHLLRFTQSSFTNTEKNTEI